VFLLNSRLGRFSAASVSSKSHGLLTYQRHPFSRSYGVILPSSFSMDHSSTLGFSPRLPVSVLVRSSSILPCEAFLGGQRREPLAEQVQRSVSGLTYNQVFNPGQATPLHRDIHHPTVLLLPRPPSRSNAYYTARESLPVSHRLRLSAST
jgi:hypothetical protein